MSAPLPASATTAPNPNQRTGEGLVLAGAIVGIVFLVINLLVMSFVGAAVNMSAARGAVPGLPGGVAGFMITLVVIVLIKDTIATVLAFQGRRLTRNGDAERGWVRALVGGILFVMGSLVPGALVLVGAFLMKPVTVYRS